MTDVNIASTFESLPQEGGRLGWGVLCFNVTHIARYQLCPLKGKGVTLVNVYAYFKLSKYRSASKAAIQPVPALVTAWR